MDRKEFGKLIAALREEHIEFSAKGMGVWTQAKLAKEANLPEKAISQIEQGRKMNLDAQTMTQLARALKLTAVEQVELFAAAAEVGADPAYMLREQANPALQFWQGDGCGVPALPEAGARIEAARRGLAKPQGWVRLLQWLWLADGVVNVPGLAPVGERAIRRPERQDQFGRLVQVFQAVGHLLFPG